jgi:hypothetical protein
VKQFIRYILILFLPVLLSACSGPAESVPSLQEVTPAPVSITAIPIIVDEPVTPGSIEPGSFVAPQAEVEENSPAVPHPIGASVAREVLAVVYNIDPEDIRVVEIERTVFSNDCLDVKVEREKCNPEEIPGFIVTLEVYGINHVLHATRDGGMVRILPVETSP